MGFFIGKILLIIGAACILYGIYAFLRAKNGNDTNGDQDDWSRF